MQCVYNIGQDRYYLGHSNVTVLVVNQGQYNVTTKAVMACEKLFFSLVVNKSDNTGESVIYHPGTFLCGLLTVYAKIYYIYADLVCKGRKFLTNLLWLSHYGKHGGRS